MTRSPIEPVRHRATLRQRLRETWLPGSRAGRIFVLVALIDSTGTGLYLAASVLFLNRAAGLSAAQVGFGLAAGALAGFLATVPAGMVADRLGAQRTLMALQLWRGVWFVAFAFVANFWQFMVVSIMLGLADRAVGPVTQAMVGAAVDGASRVHVLALMRSVRNIGFSLGAGASILLIAFDDPLVYRGMMLADAASFFLAMMALRLVKVDQPVTVRRKRLFGSPRALADRPYLALTGLNGVLTIHMTLLSVGLPLWLSRHTSAPLALVGAIPLVNTAMVVLLQVWASRGCEDVRTAAARMRWSGFALAACVALLPVAAGRPPLIAAAVLMIVAVLLTLGELWHSGGSWGLSYELAPAEHRTEYLSVFTLGRTVQEVIGPILVTSLILIHPVPGWLLLAGCLVLAGVAVPSLIKHRYPRIGDASE